MGGFKQLRVWDDAINLSVEIYKITNNGLFSKDYGLRDQIQRASVSISSNIAEGHERGSDKSTVYFLNIAKGSTAEVISQLHIAFRIGYLPEPEFKQLEDLAEKIKASLINLIKSRK